MLSVAWGWCPAPACGPPAATGRWRRQAQQAYAGFRLTHPATCQAPIYNRITQWRSRKLRVPASRAARRQNTRQPTSPLSAVTTQLSDLFDGSNMEPEAPEYDIIPARRKRNPWVLVGRFRALLQKGGCKFTPGMWLRTRVWRAAHRRAAALHPACRHRRHGRRAAGRPGGLQERQGSYGAALHACARDCAGCHRGNHGVERRLPSAGVGAAAGGDGGTKLAHQAMRRPGTAGVKASASPGARA